MTRRLESILGLLTMLTMGGCAIVDEGAVDYRRAPIQAVEAQSGAAGATPGGFEILPLDEKFVPLGPEYLDAYITRDDYYYITLKQGVIQEFWELLGPLEGAEIAVVATVFENGEVGEDGKPIKFDFSPSAVQRARVIYYSDDVERGQALNLTQLPIYGPIKYKEGNAVGVQLYIMELDEISDRTKALLQEMARLASAAATGAASPAAGKGVDVLSNLALAFLNGNHDDLIFRFDMAFAPQYQARYVPQDYLSEGERVFVRQKDRAVPFDWDTVKFDPTTGRLMNAKPVTDAEGGSKYTEYRDNTYLVMDVVKLRNATGNLSQASFQKLSELIEDIKTSEKFADTDLANLRKSVDSLIKTASAERSIEASLQDIFDPVLPESRRSVIALDLLQKFQKSLKEDNPEKREISVDLIDKALRFMWKRIGEQAPNSSALTQSLTADAIKASTNLGSLANQIAAIYRKPAGGG